MKHLGEMRGYLARLAAEGAAAPGTQDQGVDRRVLQSGSDHQGFYRLVHKAWLENLALRNVRGCCGHERHVVQALPALQQSVALGLRPAPRDQLRGEEHVRVLLLVTTATISWRA